MASLSAAKQIFTRKFKLFYDILTFRANKFGYIVSGANY